MTRRPYVLPSRGGDAGAEAVPTFSAPPGPGTLTAAWGAGIGPPRSAPRTAGEPPARPASHLRPSSAPAWLLALFSPRRPSRPSVPGCLPTSPAITASSPKRIWTITCGL